MKFKEDIPPHPPGTRAICHHITVWASLSDKLILAWGSFFPDPWGSPQGLKSTWCASMSPTPSPCSKLHEAWRSGPDAFHLG